MNEIKVSVIVPAYNEEKYLERCLETVVNQTLKELEIILVDDGSSDETYNICEKYYEEYPEKVVVIHKENEGLGPARNSGISIAQGRYIGFVDADDWIDVNMYKSMYEIAEKNKSDVVVCDVRKYFVSQNKEVVEVSLSEESGQIDIGKYIKDGLNPAYSWNKLYRREIWEEYKFKNMVYEDLDIVLTILSNCKTVSYIQKPFNTYYKRANSITTSYTNIRLMDIIQAYRDAVYNVNEKYQEETVFCVAKRILINMKTPGLVYYMADFIELINELMPFFSKNIHILHDKIVSEIYTYKEKETVPKNIYFIGTDSEKKYLEQFIREYKIIKQINVADVGNLTKEVIADIYNSGGILVTENTDFHIPIGELRMNTSFMVWENGKLLMIGSQKKCRFISMVLTVYNINKTIESNIEFAVNKYGKGEVKNVDRYKIIIY